MTTLHEIEQRLRDTVTPSQRPVAVTFCDTVPMGVPKFSGVTPSGCSFWRIAAEGRAFYTVPGDHLNCAIGAHTHNVPLPPERAKELTDTLGFMTGLGYVRMEEVPGIPRLPKTPAAVVYAPLGDAPVAPDVVLLAGRPGKIMLLLEAATRAGAASSLPLLGRPTCMALPAALSSGVVTSAGCIGNRVYTDVPEDEVYVVIPGKDLERVAAELETIVKANAALADYHAGRRKQLATT